MNMKSIIVLGIIGSSVLFISCKTIKEGPFRISYDVADVAHNIIHDTTPAKIPNDYFDFCDCTEGVYDLSPIYTFKDLYRTPFSHKDPARYLLCSIVSLNSSDKYTIDSSMCVLHATVLSNGYYFSPYILDYWIPDRIEPEGFSGIHKAYSYTLEQIDSIVRKKTEIRNIRMIVYHEEISVLKRCMSSKKNNLFLLRVNDNEDDLCALQFFPKGDYDISTLYSQLQFYKYLANRYWELYNQTNKDNTQY